MATAKLGSIGQIFPFKIVDHDCHAHGLKLRIEKRRHRICVFSYGAPEIVVGQM
jgi:hypothetical protein